MAIASQVSRVAIFGSFLVAGLSGTASAQSSMNSWWPGGSGINGREARQEGRIYGGVTDGSLTAREYARLQRRDGRIDGVEARARADGTVSPYERARLDRMLDRQSSAIYRQRHDRQGKMDSGPRGINGRERTQEARLYAGARNGSLTPQEFGRLQRREGRIDGVEARARADGIVTPRERGRLDGMLDRESRAIHRQRHDGQHR
jgi:hypothetical protein